MTLLRAMPREVFERSLKMFVSFASKTTAGSPHVANALIGEHYPKKVDYGKHTTIVIEAEFAPCEEPRRSFSVNDNDSSDEDDKDEDKEEEKDEGNEEDKEEDNGSERAEKSPVEEQRETSVTPARDEPSEFEMDVLEEMSLSDFGHSDSDRPGEDESKGDDERRRAPKETKERQRQRVFVDEADMDGDHVVCSKCGKRLKDELALRKHMVCHSDEKPFKCPHCAHRSKRKANLQSHILNMHAVDRKFKCDTCGKSYGVKQALQRHWQYGRCRPNEDEYTESKQVVPTPAQPSVHSDRVVV